MLVVTALVCMVLLTRASHICMVCVVCDTVCCFVDLCLAVGQCVCLGWCVGLCKCLARRAGRSPACPAPRHTAAHSAHTHSVPWLLAVEMGGGGGGGVGGSKIKLKIKACPESPSAPCQPARRGGGCRGSHSTATRAGVVCLSIQSSYRAPAHPAGPAPSMGRSAIDGARRAPGAG